MDKTIIKNEVSKIIGLPNNEFTFYKMGESQSFALFIHHKYFNEWINMYQKEDVLLALGRYIVEKYDIDKYDGQTDSKFIEVYLNGDEGRAILLYKCNYRLSRMVQIMTQDNQEGIEYPTITTCDFTNDLRKDFIETSSGIAFYPYEPKEEQIDIKDIAHALSHLCRFGGHCKFFYSVAQHSILVSDYLKKMGHSPLIQLYGLLHDATEGYMVDLPTPIKQGLPDYKKAENVLHDVIWDALGLERPTKEQWALIKEVDVLFQNHEANILLPKASWANPKVQIEYLVLKEEKMSEVRADFLALYKLLCEQVRTAA